MTSPLLALALAAAPALAPPPSTPARPVTDTYHGVQVVDPYRWLENGADPEVRAWSQAQNARTRAFLDALPGAAKVREEVGALIRASSPRFLNIAERRGTFFAEKWSPKLQQPILVTLRSPEDPSSERIVVDPNRIDAAGGVAIDFFAPSPDAKLVAVSLSRGGSESGDVHVYDVGTGKDLGDVVPRVNGGTAGGSVAWAADGKGFFYTRYPRGDERPPADMNFYQQVWFHRLGTPTEKDVYEIGKELPRIAEIQLLGSRDGRTLVAQVSNGDGGEREYWLRRGDGRGWARISTFSDLVVRAAVGDGGAVFLVSRKDAPRGRVLRLGADRPQLAAATEIVPQGDGAIEEILATARHLYVHEIVGGPSRLLQYGLDGKGTRDVPIPAVSAVSSLARAGADDVLFENESYLEPAAWWRWSGSAAKAHRTKLFQTSPARFDDAEVVRDVCVSKDGTKVPLTILRRKGTTLDGNNPTLLYGYGGYGISETPSFSASRRLWLDRGGIWAVAHLRGGSEFGEEWHLAGNLTRKQNVFDDFAACAKTLVASGYTTAAKLAALGGSNGGLLMGAEIVQHPEQWRAVVSMVGVYDSLRSETTPNGEFNVTEYGTVKDEAQFRALYVYSPYHHVVDGQTYPAVLLTSGENDPRVDAWHSRKFAARLQAANVGPNPILLRTSETGHGIGTALDETIAQRADMFSFLFHELAMDAAKPAPTR